MVKDYGLGYVLGFLWISNWIGYGIILAWGPQPMDWMKFWEGTFENNQSEFLQLFAFVVLSKYFIFRGSPQSRDGDDRLEKKVDSLRG